MPADPPFDLDQIDRLLTTTKAVRRRLDLQRPVDHETVVECIRLASYSPNASNAQEWHWIVVDDPEQRARVGEQYRKCTVEVVSRILAVKEAAGDEAGARISRSIIYLAEHMAEVPVIVIPCYDVEEGSRRYGRDLGDPVCVGAGGTVARGAHHVHRSRTHRVELLPGVR